MGRTVGFIIFHGCTQIIPKCIMSCIDMNTAKINSKSIKEIINNSLEVPTFQRDYSWSEENVEDFIGDIYLAMEENSDEEYFIGSMVMVEESNEKKIIDGQQRLATSFLILLSIFKYIQAKEKDSFKYTNLVREDDTPKLKLNTKDNKYWEALFKNLIEGDEISTNEIKEIKNARGMCEKKIGEIKTKGKIEDFKKFLLENVKIALVEVNDEVNAYFIFEVLNDRGQELSSLELIKNYFYKVASENSQETLNKSQELWGGIISFFKDENSNKHQKNCQNFLYAFLVSKYAEKKKLIKKKILKRWKEIVLKDNVFETLNDISEYSEKYSFFDNWRECLQKA